MGSPVTAMLLPLVLLFLTCQARGSPTLVEFINSGLSIIGAKYVPPESQEGETVVVTRQSSCRDCSRQGRFAFEIFTTTTAAPPLPCCPGTSGCAKCGVEKTRRIIGGVETAAGVYPWIAALSYSGDLGGCSATLVSSKWAITAAHCIGFGGPTSLVLGEHDLSSSNDAEDTNRKEVSVSVIVHPGYDSANANNDIALLKLAEEVDLSIYTPAGLLGGLCRTNSQSLRLGQDGPMRINNFLQIDGGRRDRGLGRRLRRRVRAGAVLCQPCHFVIQWENHRSDALRFRDREGCLPG